MFKGLVSGIVIGILLAAGGTYLYFTGGYAPVAVTDAPIPFEKILANAALHARIDKQAPAQAPMPADEQTFLAGAGVYKNNCAGCHGLPTVSKSAIAEGMYPSPPQLFRGTGVTDDPVGETYWKVENGIRMTGMPSFKGRLAESQIWQVSQLLAHADKISAPVKAALAEQNPPMAMVTPDSGGEKKK